MSQVNRLEDIPEEEFPVKIINIAGEEGEEPIHQFFVIRAGTGFIHFAEDTNAIAEGKMPPTTFLTLNETSNGTGPFKPGPANPAHILVGFEFPNKAAFDLFMNGFKTFGERHFPSTEEDDNEMVQETSNAQRILFKM